MIQHLPQGVSNVCPSGLTFRLDKFAIGYIEKVEFQRCCQAWHLDATRADFVPLFLQMSLVSENERRFTPLPFPALRAPSLKIRFVLRLNGHVVDRDLVVDWQFLDLHGIGSDSEWKLGIVFGTSKRLTKGAKTEHVDNSVVPFPVRALRSEKWLSFVERKFAQVQVLLCGLSAWVDAIGNKESNEAPRVG